MACLSVACDADGDGGLYVDEVGSKGGTRVCRLVDSSGETVIILGLSCDMGASDH